MKRMASEEKLMCFVVPKGALPRCLIHLQVFGATTCYQDPPGCSHRSAAMASSPVLGIHSSEMGPLEPGPGLSPRCFSCSTTWREKLEDLEERWLVPRRRLRRLLHSAESGELQLSSAWPINRDCSLLLVTVYPRSALLSATITNQNSWRMINQGFDDSIGIGSTAWVLMIKHRS